jgi:hypothetical protein
VVTRKTVVVRLIPKDLYRQTQGAENDLSAFETCLAILCFPLVVDLAIWPIYSFPAQISSGNFFWPSFMAGELFWFQNE